MSKDVTIYTIPNCQPCRRTKKMFQDAGIYYREVDLSEDDNAKDYVKYVLGASSAPVVVVSERRAYWSGFSEGSIRNAIEWIKSDSQAESRD